MFSNENIWQYNPKNLTRFEKRINFGIDNGGDGWRLSGFNNSEFNIYKGREAEDWIIWGNMRTNRTYPFKAKFTLNHDHQDYLKNKLKIKNLNIKVSYLGKINDGEFKSEKTSQEYTLNGDDWILNYQNYTCINNKNIKNTDDCLEIARQVNAISHNKSVLIVEVKNSQGNWVGLDL